MEITDIEKYAKQVKFLALGGDGAGGAATAVLETTGSIKTVIANQIGSGYSVDDVITITAGNNDATLTVTSVDGSGGVTGFTLTTAGTGLTDDTDVATTVSPVNGTGFTVDITVEFDVDTVTIVDAGSDYISAIVTFTDIDTLAMEYGEATIVAGEITAITPPIGVKYSSVPTISIQAGPPADSTAFITALQTFDTSLQDERILSALEDVILVEPLTAISAPIVLQVIEDLRA